MTLRNSAGEVLNKTEFTALLTSVPAPPAKFRVGSPIFETYSLSGEGPDNFEAAKRRKFSPGAELTQAQIDALFPTATATSIAPATGPAVGLTTVTITGTGLGGVEGVLFDGLAATEVKVKSKTQVTCKTPAHAAGAVTVTVKDDGGDVAKPAFYTYT